MDERFSHEQDYLEHKLMPLLTKACFSRSSAKAIDLQEWKRVHLLINELYISAKVLRKGWCFRKKLVTFFEKIRIVKSFYLSRLKKDTHIFTILMAGFTWEN